MGDGCSSRFKEELCADTSMSEFYTNKKMGLDLKSKKVKDMRTFVSAKTRAVLTDGLKDLNGDLDKKELVGVWHLQTRLSAHYMPSLKRVPHLGLSFERHLIGVSSYDDGFKGELRHLKFSDNSKIEFKPSADNNDPDKFTEECISPG